MTNNYTVEEFNIAAAKLAGHRTEKREDGEYLIFFHGKSVGELLRVFGNYHDDLNLLLPLAWKYKIDVDYDPEDEDWSAFGLTVSASNKNPIQAIRECLLAIRKEK